MRTISESAVSLRDFAGLFFALAAVASAVILLFTFSWKQEDADKRINHTRSLYRDSQQLLVSSAQVNTNVRNYIMTKNSKYLAQYELSKADLRNEAETVTNTTRSPSVKKLLKEWITPGLKTFLATSDQLVSAASVDSAVQPILQEQEAAGTAFDQTLDALVAEELTILQTRKDRVLDLSTRIAMIRTLILLIAFIAILFSIFTLRTVMKKDKQKIESLQAAVEQTQQAQQAASEALDEARKSNELKRQFMANISHEIRTPMTGILGMADLLCTHDLDERSKRYAQVLFKSSQQLLSVLNDLLNFSQLETSGLTLDQRPFAIRQTIKDVTSLADNSAREKHLTLTSLVDKEVPLIIIGDEEKIRQVISTLVSNSLKFTRQGGVQISVELLDQTIVRVAVIDTGIGIQTQDLDKIFLPFVQVDGGIRRTQGGTGLSLTIARHLVAMMEGEIGVLSEPGGGSIFWFTFTGAAANG